MGTPTPYIAGTLPTRPAVPGQGAATPTPATLGITPISPILRGQKVYVLSPTVAASGPSKEKILGGLRAFSVLITSHLGQKVAITASSLWLAADVASTVKTFRDPESSKADRMVEISGLSSDACELFGGILNAPHLNHAAKAINFATVFGDHVHTGQISFTPSEIAQFSTAPGSEVAAYVLKITEVWQPENT
jgi:hypothetical protein